MSFKNDDEAQDPLDPIRDKIAGVAVDVAEIKSILYAISLVSIVLLAVIVYRVW